MKAQSLVGTEDKETERPSQGGLEVKHEGGVTGVSDIEEKVSLKAVVKGLGSRDVAQVKDMSSPPEASPAPCVRVDQKRADRPSSAAVVRAPHDANDT